MSSALPPEIDAAPLLSTVAAAGANGDSQRSMVSGVRRQPVRGGRFLWALSQDCDEAEELLDHTQTLITAFFPAIGPASTLPMTEEDQQTTLVRRGRSVDNMPRPQGDCLEP